MGEYVNGARAERAHIITLLRARATSEIVTADRWAQSGGGRNESRHRSIAWAFEEFADRLEGDTSDVRVTPVRKDER